MDYFPENTLTHYKTKLPETIHLQGQWEVGLSEIQYPHTWYNVNHTDAWFMVRNKTNLSLLDKVTLPSGYYESVEDVIKAMRMITKRTENRKAIDISYNRVNQKTKFNVKDGYIFHTSKELSELLGFHHKDFSSGEYYSEEVSDINQGLYSLYVYCPLLEPRTVGDIKVPLLRIVPIEGANGDFVSKSFQTIQYMPLQHRDFEEVEIILRDDTGQPVPFKRGKVVITLHFRRARSMIL